MYEPVFSSVPHDWDECWARIRLMIAGWYDLPTGVVGRRTAECAELERELGLDLSPSIHEWSSLHDELSSSAYRGAFRDNFDFGWHTELDAVTLMIQVEQDRYWGVTRETVSVPDPPVAKWQAYFDRPGWRAAEPWEPSLSGFALDKLISSLRGPAGGFLAWTSTERARSLANDLDEAFETRLDLDGAIFFEDVDAIVRIRPNRRRQRG